MITLALDPSRTATGYYHTAGHYGVWHLTVSGSEHHGNALVRLRDHLRRAFDEWGFDRLAFEEGSFGSHNPNIQAVHNELRGVIKLVAAELGVPFRGFNPATLKKFATGNGRAKKPQMIRAAETMLGVLTTDDNIADAAFVHALAQAVWTRPTVEGADDLPAKKAKRSSRRPRRTREARLF